MPAEPGTSLRVCVVYSAGPGHSDTTDLNLAAHSTVADALAHSGVLLRHPAAAALACGVWGRAQSLDAVLRDRDRVEVYRPLTVDPKEARRQRYGLHKDRLKAQARKVAARRA